MTAKRSVFVRKGADGRVAGSIAGVRGLVADVVCDAVADDGVVDDFTG